ncbi:MFS transporter [Nonomuraea sp. NPDC059194]|uniref:MFS transporter n=1 Tax=Nonomuraea sp. NPDC059194 TaxID=3346764 RepID=UPI00368CA845
MSSPMRADLPLRLTRAAAFSAVCVLLATLGHRAAGGTGPETWAFALGGAAVMAVSLALSGRERSAPTINLTLVALQTGLHELFGLDGSGPVLTLAHGHAQNAGLGESLGMLLAHLTATLITGWWLARGEAALWSLLRRLGHHLLRLLPPLPAVAPLRQAPARAARRLTGRGALLRHIVSRRGPPLPAC